MLVIYLVIFVETIGSPLKFCKITFGTIYKSCNLFQTFNEFCKITSGTFTSFSNLAPLSSRFLFPQAVAQTGPQTGVQVAQAALHTVEHDKVHAIFLMALTQPLDSQRCGWRRTNIKVTSSSTDRKRPFILML